MCCSQYGWLPLGRCAKGRAEDENIVKVDLKNCKRTLLFNGQMKPLLRVPVEIEGVRYGFLDITYLDLS